MSETKAVNLMHGDVTRLEDLVEREALGEVCRSFFDLFGLSIRIFSAGGSLLADVHKERSICRYVNGLVRGRVVCIKTVEEVRQIIPEDATEVFTCFTGAVYHVSPILYEERQLGRIILGPFLPAEIGDAPDTLLSMVPEEDIDHAIMQLAEMPRVRSETAERMAFHLCNVLDLILFAGHKAQLTSEMHLASVRESYRELEEKSTNLQKAYDDLKELDRLKSNFLATVSHELRTPLTSVIGYSEMLLSDVAGELNHEQRSFVDTIYNKGELLLSLITSLLDLNKLERGRIQLDLKRIDPRSLLEEIQQIMLPEAKKKRINLEVRCDADLPDLTADPLGLKQILTNLAGNALKFTPQGGLIELSAKSVDMAATGTDGESWGASIMMVPERGVQFAVRDTGIGIDKKEIDRIFDAFYQVDGGSTREHGGIGLGLSIANRLAQAHGGSIQVESEPQMGSVFYVTLPMQPGSGGR